LATLGELTSGVAHELNNPLNNVALFVGNAIDIVELGVTDKRRILRELCQATQQIQKATEIISHLRTFGRAAPAIRESVLLREAIWITGSLAAPRVEIAFADSGYGIPPGLEGRIFDPFFTTKEVGKGTGLGLSITYGIIKEHGGTISVKSQPGHGATFLIQLPLATAETEDMSMP